MLKYVGYGEAKKIVDLQGLIYRCAHLTTNRGFSFYILITDIKFVK